ncbi:spermidine/putrescine ABC transporter substrate-binding protein, partial [Nostoc sp. NIES-2111]
PNSAAFEQLPKQIKNNENFYPPSSILEKCERISPVGEFEDVYERYWTQLTSS